jgi:predicted phage tail protein
MAAEAEVKRLRPLASTSEGNTAALELAAAEMAQAAANLVAMERDIISMELMGVRVQRAGVPGGG